MWKKKLYTHKFSCGRFFLPQFCVLIDTIGLKDYNEHIPEGNQKNEIYKVDTNISGILKAGGTVDEKNIDC